MYQSFRTNIFECSCLLEGFFNLLNKKIKKGLLLSPFNFAELSMGSPFLYAAESLK